MLPFFLKWGTSAAATTYAYKVEWEQPVQLAA
jgi:hypothetical protein